MRANSCLALDDDIMFPAHKVLALIRQPARFNRYFFDWLLAIHFNEHVPLSIIIDQRLGLFKVHVDPACYRLHFIILPLVKFRAVIIARPGTFGGLYFS